MLTKSRILLRKVQSPKLNVVCVALFTTKPPIVQDNQTGKDYAILSELSKRLWPKKSEPNSFSIKSRVIVSLGLLMGGKLVNIQVPFLFNDLVDTLTATTSAIADASIPPPLAVSLPISLVLGYGLARSTSNLMQELRNAIFAYVSHDAIRRISRQIFEHLLALDLQFHLNRNTGGLSRTIDRGTRSINFALTAIVFNVLPTLLEVGLVSGILAYNLGIQYGIVAASTVAIYTVYTIKISDWRTGIRKEMNKYETTAGGRVTDSLLNYQTVKLFGNELHEVNRYEESLKGFQKSSIQTQTSLSLLNFGQNAIFSVGLVAMMYMSTQDILLHGHNIGDLILVNGLLFQLSIPLNFIGTVYRELKQATIDMESLFKLLTVQSRVTDSIYAKPFEYKQGKICFDAVQFHYPGAESRNILNNISFTIPAGKRVAIVGASGSGKSTILSLLFRYFDPISGHIYIDDQELSTLQLHTLRKYISVVPQDTVLFNDTIYYNISYGDLKASKERVQEVTRLARLDELIARLPDGYNTIVGERGLKLSGGEKQRVAIARCLLKDSPIVLLDEV